MENEKSPLTVGINQKMSVGELLLFAVQHLMGITFLLAVPGIIGAACGLTSADIGYMVQSCFITAGLVTILQSIFILNRCCIWTWNSLWLNVNCGHSSCSIINTYW